MLYFERISCCFCTGSPPGGDAAQKQHEILSKYNKAATTQVKPEDLAVVPMVYPFAK